MATFDQNPIGKKEQKYSKILNNLLDIKTGDSCLFAKINSTSTFDMFTKIGKDKSRNLLIENEYRTKLEDLDIQNLIIELKTIKRNLKDIQNEIFEPKQLLFYGERAIVAFQRFNQQISKLLESQLRIAEMIPIAIDETIAKFELELQRSLNRWKKFVKLVDDKYNLTNMWPLYIACGFITVNFDNGKVLNAPIFLKEAKIKIEGSNVLLETNDDWVLNDKLIYILKKNNLYFPSDLNTENINFIDLMNEVLPYWKIPEKSIDFYNNKFNNFKRDEITSKKIDINPGILLGIFYPAGGYLRELMQKIIDQNEIDDILKIHPDKKIYEQKVFDVLKHNYDNIVKIQESSYAQDKALISALNQDTVIWGPPGTGKSQVIANIIANILYRQKSAIVMSQKKAALDVLKKRLKGLSKFVFFFMDQKELSKEEFYGQLQEFIKTIEYSRSVDYRQKQNLISLEQSDTINKISELKREGKYQASVQALKDNNGNIPKIKKIATINSSYSYPSTSENEKNFVELAGELSQIKKNGYIFWWKYPDKFIDEVKRAFKIKNNLEISNLSQAIKPFKETTVKNIEYLVQTPEILEYSYKHLDDENFISDFLSNKILERVKKEFSFNNPIEWKKYDRFRSAIKAGRRLPHNFIKDHSEVIQKLFPIIITTPATTFSNWEKENFDYAIIDEASQMFLEVGLPIMYLSKTKILAGDPEQMQPTSWFSTRDISDEEDEEDNAENAISVLDYALDKQVYEVMLDQNYRSNAASLMSFSSKEFYKSKLEVIDKKNKWENKPIEVINVNGKWNNGTNQEEADEVIKILKKVSHQYETIIILAFNIKQKQLIEDILITGEPELWKKVANDHTITIRNIENIQGDEADLVLASVVYDETTKMGGTYVARAGTGKNALNVAISRAKDKIIVVKSVNAETVNYAKSEDFKVFKEWLQFLDLKEEEQRTYSILKESPIQFGEFDSSFEEDVHKKLMSDLKFKNGKLYTITKQFPVGSKRIDLAILDEENNYILGIEVDGYNYHLGMGVDKFLQDRSREEFIENKGYKLFRVSEIRWYLNSNAVLEQIQNVLNSLILTSK